MNKKMKHKNEPSTSAMLICSYFRFTYLLGMSLYFMCSVKIFFTGRLKYTGGPQVVRYWYRLNVDFAIHKTAVWYFSVARFVTVRQERVHSRMYISIKSDKILLAKLLDCCIFSFLIIKGFGTFLRVQTNHLQLEHHLETFYIYFL